MNFIASILFMIPVVLMLFGFLMSAMHYLKEGQVTAKCLNYGIFGSVFYVVMSSVVYVTMHSELIFLILPFVVFGFFSCYRIKLGGEKVE